MFWENEPSTNTPIDQIAMNMFAGGWTKMSSQWTASYSSADAPTFIMILNNDFIDDISIGMKVRVLQGASYKYFIITATQLVGSDIYVTMYGGTDYTLTNTAITSVWFSAGKAPQGFPMNPNKWSVITKITSNISQATPTQNVWYNLGTTTISIPIGNWNVSFEAPVAMSTTAAQTTMRYQATLSTANNSESDTEFTTFSGMSGASATLDMYNQLYKVKPVILASKTTYYFLSRTTGTNGANLIAAGSLSPLIIKAVCAYL